MKRTESAQKVNSGEENCPAAPVGIQTRNLSITSPALLPTSYPDSHVYTLYNTQMLLSLLYVTPEYYYLTSYDSHLLYTTLDCYSLYHILPLILELLPVLSITLHITV